MSSPIKPITGFVNVAGGKLYYESAGEGEPLVLLHAGIADSRMWENQFNALAPHYRVIRYDARGFGRSETEDGSFSNCDDLATLLQQLHIQKAHILGLSRGGEIALDFTLTYPALVTRLILAAAGVSGYEHPSEKTSERETDMFSKMDDLWEAGNFEQLNEMELQMFVDGPGQAIDRVDPYIRQQVQEMNTNNFLHLQQEDVAPKPLDTPAVERLHEIQIPTLIIVGDLDTSGTLAMADVLAQGIAGAQKVTLSDVAHMVNLERPEEFNRMVIEFLGG